MDILIFQSTRSQDRDNPEKCQYSPEDVFQSTRSQDRDQEEERQTSQNGTFQSTRSQDRDYSILLYILMRFHFNPLGRKTETICSAPRFHSSPFQSTRSQDRDMTSIILFDFDYISIHSVARPRLIYAHLMTGNYVFQSTRSQDRDNVSILAGTLLKNFNPLGRKTETYGYFYVDDYQNISIHSVARPRLSYD